MKNEVRKEYDKARKNLQAQVRRMEKAGYIFKEEQVPSIPKRVTEGSTRRLKEIQSKLYDRAVFQVKEIYEDIGENVVEYTGRIAKARRRWKKTKEETQKEVFIESDIFEEEHKKPEPVDDLKDIYWDEDMRKLLDHRGSKGWVRYDSSQFLYKNADKYGVISDVVHIGKLYHDIVSARAQVEADNAKAKTEKDKKKFDTSAWDGSDHTTYEYFQVIMPRYLPEYILDPEGTESVIIYNRAEWEAYERGL